MKRALVALVAIAGLAASASPASALTGDEKLTVTITNSRSNPSLCDVKVSLLDARENSAYALRSGSGVDLTVSTNRRGSATFTVSRPDSDWSSTTAANIELLWSSQPIDIYFLKITNRCT